MSRDQEMQATPQQKKQDQRRLAAELTAELDIPFVIWEDFEQALAGNGPKVRKV